MTIKDSPKHPVAASLRGPPDGDLDDFLGMVVLDRVVAWQLDLIVPNDAPPPVDQVGLLHLPQLLRRLVSRQHFDNGATLVIRRLAYRPLSNKCASGQFVGSYDEDGTRRDGIAGVCERRRGRREAAGEGGGGVGGVAVVGVVGSVADNTGQQGDRGPSCIHRGLERLSYGVGMLDGRSRGEEAEGLLVVGRDLTLQQRAVYE